MKRFFFLPAILVGMVAVAPQTEAATLDLTYWNGSLFENQLGFDSCETTPTHAIRHNQADTSEDGRCWVTIPLPLQPGTRVHQITVFYTNIGEEGESPGNLDVVVGREDISRSETDERYVPIVYWSRGITLEPHDGPMSLDVLAPDIAQPGFENGFTVEETGDYGVGIGLRRYAGFYGIRVSYDIDGAESERSLARSARPPQH